MGQGETKGASASHVDNDDGLLAGGHARDDDGLEPSYSQVVANASRHSVRPSARPSIRPSAFGPPRNSTRPPPAPSLEDLAEVGMYEAGGEAGGEEFAELRALGSVIGQGSDARASHGESLRDSARPTREVSEEPTPSGARRRARNPEQGVPLGASIASSQSPATFRADLEDLLPFVSAKSSVPPTLPALPDKPTARPQDPKRNRVSLAIFVVMLLASIVPLARYASNGSKDAKPTRATSDTRAPEQVEMSASAVEHQELAPAPSGPGESKGADGTSARATTAEALPEKLPADPMLEALAQAEANLPANAAAAADQLMSQGLKALAAGDERFAEALLGRALKRDDDNPRAYFALARIRMAQGNLQGAEGWIVSALHKRPRRAEYHLLYATVLEGLGRTAEAAQAKARAEELRSEHAEQP